MEGPVSHHTKEELAAEGATVIGLDGASPASEVDLGGGRYRYTFTVEGDDDRSFIVTVEADGPGSIEHE